MKRSCRGGKFRIGRSHFAANSAGRARRGRSAIAATECAICLPIIVMLTLATLEFTSAIFLKETLTISAYEGARVGVQRSATNDQAKKQAQSVLDARGVKSATVTVTPSDITKLNALDVVTVQVTAPISGNSFFVGKFMTGRTVSATVNMRREFGP